MLDTTWEILDMVVERLESKSGPLGLKFVGKYNEKIIPNYPAVVVLPGPRVKTYHGLHTFNVLVQLDLYIYHANLSLTKRERSKADMQLVSNVEAELDSDFLWRSESGAPQLINAFVSNEEPGVMQPRAGKSSLVICTKLTWRATSQRRF